MSERFSNKCGRRVGISRLLPTLCIFLAGTTLAFAQVSDDVCIEEAGTARCIGPVTSQFEYQAWIPGALGFVASSEAAAIEGLRQSVQVNYKTWTLNFDNQLPTNLPPLSPGPGSAAAGDYWDTYWQLIWMISTEVTQHRSPIKGSGTDLFAGNHSWGKLRDRIMHFQYDSPRGPVRSKMHPPPSEISYEKV